jgi:hypothetical protein
MSTTKSATKKTARKTSARVMQKRGTPGAAGNLTRAEITNLILQAQEAFNYQTALSRIEPGTKFDDWRRDQVLDAAGKPGLSKLERSDWKTVKAHFLTLSGREDEAFALVGQTGLKTYRPSDSNDTWETCETYVELIRKALADHAQVPAVCLLPGITHIHAGWLIAAARQRSGKPTLTMETLAERLDPKTLNGLLSHLRNHISRREGRADPDLRSPRNYPSDLATADPDAPF